MSEPWCAHIAQTIVPCPTTCKENAWHHHHNHQGMLWTNSGARCPASPIVTPVEDLQP